MLWKNSILPLFKTFDLFVLIIAELFSKNIDRKLELILTLCFHSHLNPSQEKSTLPKKILGSSPLKPGTSYRSNQSSRSVKRTDRENQSIARESK
jgi:formylmethanofuran dehydrogenase subunit E-like metal-binding protein